MDKAMSGEKDKNITKNTLLYHNVLIAWEPSYNLGIPIVDEQHRGVVTTINSLYYGMQHKHGESMLVPIINMIYDYTRVHFDIEESFLERCSYPDMKNHRALHAELTDTLTKVGRKSILSKDPYQFLDFLKTWWIDHICDKDKVFRGYILTMPNLTREVMNNTTSHSNER